VKLVLRVGCPAVTKCLSLDNPSQDKKAIHYPVTKYTMHEIFSALNFSVLLMPMWKKEVPLLRISLEERRNLFSMS
jgi:hypothetical protein